MIGVSFDTVAKNKKFKEVESFKFDLWSDLGRELGMYYGAAKSTTQSAASRITIVLDEHGTWRYWYSQSAIGFDFYNHPLTVLKDLSALFGKPLKDP